MHSPAAQSPPALMSPPASMSKVMLSPGERQAWTALLQSALGNPSDGPGHSAASRSRPRTRKTWSDGEQQALLEGHHRGQGIEILALRLGRTRGAVIRRLGTLGAMQLSHRLQFAGAVQTLSS